MHKQLRQKNQIFSNTTLIFGAKAQPISGSPIVLDSADPMTPDDELAGATCYVGIDLSASQDTTAVSVIFPDGSGGHDCKVIAFLPGGNFQQKSDHDRANYSKLARDGHLRLTSGNVIDHSAIIEYVQELAEQYDVTEIVLYL